MNGLIFNNVKKALMEGPCEIRFKSLTSGREIIGVYRDAGINQSDGTKILCMDTVSERYEDIDLETIISIKRLF